jgi:hypothetical protein
MAQCSFLYKILSRVGFKWSKLMEWLYYPLCCPGKVDLSLSFRGDLGVIVVATFKGAATS